MNMGEIPAPCDVTKGSKMSRCPTRLHKQKKLEGIIFNYWAPHRPAGDASCKKEHFCTIRDLSIRLVATKPVVELLFCSAENIDS